MKKCVWLCVAFFLTLGIHRASAQTAEAQQLLLNVEKLAQLKTMLSQLKKGYTVLVNGYSRIKGLTEGNFDLHHAFLDALFQVSPAVRNYPKIPVIISQQVALVKEYKAASRQFTASGLFLPEELSYFRKVYGNLFQQSLKNLETLSTVLTAGRLRMSDEERLKAIDRVAADMEDALSFLRHFNSGTRALGLQRAQEAGNVRVLKNLYGITD
ncbi:MAG: TerB family tellurite resistance protein [Chitinophagaceae bacterium]|nr:MAG: TerB family tellurite resistance protein [Chitinophagaceae bacterium]